MQFSGTTANINHVHSRPRLYLERKFKRRHSG
jgi:hypothetical protein